MAHEINIHEKPKKECQSIRSMTKVSMASNTQTIMRNIVSIAGARLFSQVILALTGIYLIRYLGLELYSEYSTAILFMGVFSLLGRVGFNQVFLREGSKDPNSASFYFGAALLVNSVLVAFGFLVACCVSYFRYNERVFILCILLGASQVFMCLQRIPLTVYQIHHKMHIPSLIAIFVSLYYAGGIWIAIQWKSSVFVLAVFHLSMNMLVMLLNLTVSVRFIKPSIYWGYIKKLLLIGKRFVFIDIMTAFYAQANGFILAALNLGSEVGIYNAPMRLYVLFDMVLHVINMAASPAFYKSFEEPQKIIRGLNLLVKYFSVHAVVLGTILFCRSEWIMTTIFNAEFEQSSEVLKILGIAIVFRFIYTLFVHIVYSKEKEQLMMIVTAVCVLFSLPVTLLIAPKYGAFGCAYIFLFCEVLMGLFCLVMAEHLLQWPGIWKLYIGPSIAGAASFLIMQFSSEYPITGILGSIVAYYSILFMIKYYKVSEINSLIAIFWGKKNR